MTDYDYVLYVVPSLELGWIVSILAFYNISTQP